MYEKQHKVIVFATFSQLNIKAIILYNLYDFHIFRLNIKYHQALSLLSSFHENVQKQ